MLRASIKLRKTPFVGGKKVLRKSVPCFAEPTAMLNFNNIRSWPYFVSDTKCTISNNLQSRQFISRLFWITISNSSSLSRRYAKVNICVQHHNSTDWQQDKRDRFQEPLNILKLCTTAMDPQYLNGLMPLLKRSRCKNLSIDVSR